jgi:ornithine cyclodeaminase/alanine dehydrogenase-like protein (mu-crystallin family)
MREPAAPQPVPPLRYLSAADVDACLPSVERRIDLAAEALRALAREAAEMPPKIGVHPRPGTLLHAMPAWLRERDLVGLKWVAAFPNNKSRGLAAINGLVVLNDAETGLPTWIMDAARITAVRTAAVSGVAIRLYARSARSVAILGAGVQARSHLEVVAGQLPDCQAVLYDRHHQRAAALADEHNERHSRQWLSVAPGAREAVGEADLVITVATLGAASQVLTNDWLREGAVVVAVDFATYASAQLARTASVFAVDDREQFLYYRANGYFDAFPEPATTLGEALVAPDQAGQPTNGRPVLVVHLGVGLADVVLADAVRQGWLSAPLLVAEGAPPRLPVAPLAEILADLDRDRSDR